MTFVLKHHDDAVRSQSMTFTVRDANGFTPAEAAELKRRIADVDRGQTKN